MTDRVTRVATAVGCVALLALAWTGCKRKPQWQKLAEDTNSTGQRFVVAQEHYHLIDGWRIGFWLIDSDKKVYGSLLEMEARRWDSAELIQTNETVEVWRGTRLAGTMNLSTRFFQNALNGAVDKYVDGFNGVQGQRVTNLVFDVLE